jgi:glutathionylspermidine synthase
VAHCAVAANPIRAGERLAPKRWREIRERAIFEFCKWDVQCEDHCVLANFPLLIDPETVRFLSQKTEALAREALAAEAEILERPELLRQLELPKAIQEALERSPGMSLASRELRVMRFDFHFTSQGWRISEANADVPGGFIEAGAWNSLFAAECSNASAPENPSRAYADAIRAVSGENGLVALVHATAYSDDRQVMMYLARAFREQGMRAVLCSPAHLGWGGGYAEINASFASGHPDVIVRFFPAEWLPNLPTTCLWQSYFGDSKTPLSNPGGALVSQTKRFPLVWEHLKTDIATWRGFLPETRCLSKMNDTLDEAWVLKPALGRVGEGVSIKGVTAKDEFEHVARLARKQPKQWVAQRRFEIVAVDSDDKLRFPCIGVFTIGGKACGFYGRISESPIIDRDARDVAVLVSDEGSGRER